MFLEPSLIIYFPVSLLYYMRHWDSRSMDISKGKISFHITQQQSRVSVSVILCLLKSNIGLFTRINMDVLSSFVVPDHLLDNVVQNFNAILANISHLMITSEMYFPNMFT